MKYICEMNADPQALQTLMEAKLIAEDLKTRHAFLGKQIKDLEIKSIENAKRANESILDRLIETKIIKDPLKDNQEMMVTLEGQIFVREKKDECDCAICQFSKGLGL